MENKNVGLLIIGIAFVMGVIVFIFNSALNNISGLSCNMGPTCTMYDTIKTQTWLSLSLVGVILIVGVVIMFTKPREKIIVKTKRENKRKLNLKDLDKNEKKIIGIIQNENGAIFQSELMEKLEIGKVGMTRLLDKLESKQLIERKRRGMNNVVVLKS